MRLAYKVLWIDDSPDWVEPLRDSLEEHLVELGFKLDVELHQDGSNIESLARQEDIDLILMDERLPKAKGGELINKIRESDVYVDVVYYSEAPVKGVEGGRDGVWCTTRADAEDVIKRVIDTSIRKVQDVNNMRGLVISEAIDIESQIEEIVAKYFGTKAEFVKEEMLRENGVYDLQKKLKLLKVIVKAQINSFNVDGVNVDSLGGMDRKHELESCQSVCRKLDREVMDRRNMLAHVKPHTVDNKVCLKSRNRQGDIVECDASWYKEVRIALLKHSENLTALERIIIGGSGH